jgi:hypothetical protein
MSGLGGAVAIIGTGGYEPMRYGHDGHSRTAVADPLNLFPMPVTRVAAGRTRRRGGRAP